VVESVKKKNQALPGRPGRHKRFKRVGARPTCCVCSLSQIPSNDIFLFLHLALGPVASSTASSTQ
jgi:hypothetical protein